jgi:hypothetical protein
LAGKGRQQLIRSDNNVLDVVSRSFTRQPLEDE